MKVLIKILFIIFVLQLKYLYIIIKLGLCVLRTTNDNEMTKINKGLHLKFLLFSDIYKIQIVQNTTQSSKGRFGSN